MTRTVLLISIGKGILILGSPPPIPVGAAYSFTFTVSGPAATYTITKTGALPTGITFTDNGNGTATLAGTSTVSGNFPISVTATSNTRLTKTQSYILNAQALTLQLLQTAQLYRGIAFTGLTLLATGGTGTGYVYSASGLPTGLTLNTSTGAITGTVTAAIGTYACTFGVIDSASNSASMSGKIVVLSRLAVTSANPLPKGEVGKVIPANALTVSGATGTVTYTAAGPTDGLSLSPAGVLSGTPVGPAGLTFNTTATDSGTGDTLDIALQITIYPAFTLVNNFPNIVAGVPMTGTISTTGGSNGPYAFAWGSPNALPAWMTAVVTNAGGGPTNANGVVTFSGTPPLTNTAYTNNYSFNFSATDALGLTVATLISGAVKAPGAVQPKQSGTPIGASGALNFDFTGGAWAISNDGVTLTINLPAATASVPGYLLASDWSTFNNKYPAPVVTTITTSVTIAAARWNIVNVNAAALTPVLPASPTAGDIVQFVCTLACTSLTIGGNGGSILGKPTMVCDLFQLNGAVLNFTLIYNATVGWLVA